MQQAMTAEIQKVQESVEILVSRVDKLEKDLLGTTEQLRLCQTPTSSSSPTTGSSGIAECIRKRHTPLALSVRIPLL